VLLAVLETRPLFFNLTPSQISYMIGRRYERTKKAVTNVEGLGGRSDKIDEGQNVPQQRTSETIAAEYGLNEKTVRRYGKEAALIDTRLVLKKEDVIQARAKRKQLDTLKQNTTVMQKTAERTPTITTREELAKLAGVSHDTVAKK
jgi:hypothetical protein